MQSYKDHGPSSRLTAAATAKEAMLAKFRAQPKPDDPAVLERQAAMKAVAEARAARAEERRVARQAELDRIAAEQAVIAAKKADDERAEAEYQARKADDAAQAQADSKARALALAAEQKALRDARYARRKAR